MFGWLSVSKHVVGKEGKANRSAGLHSRQRDKLNRLYLRTKGYSKSVAMPSESIDPVCFSRKLV